METHAIQRSVLLDDGTRHKFTTSIRIVPLDRLLDEISAMRPGTARLTTRYHGFYRTVTNFIRHHHTDYDTVRAYHRRAFGPSNDSIVKPLYYDLIARHYPWLAEYCEYKKRKLFFERAYGIRWDTEDFHPTGLTRDLLHATIPG